MTTREGGLPERFAVLRSENLTRMPEFTVYSERRMGLYPTVWRELASGTREAMEAALRLLGGK